MDVGPLCARPAGLLPIRYRANMITGEWVDLGPAFQIDAEDLDWLQGVWLEGDRIDYELAVSP